MVYLDAILIIIVMGLILFGIDMLAAKINLTFGRIVSVLSFFVMSPVGLAAGVVALVCISKKANKRDEESVVNVRKSKKTTSATASRTSSHVIPKAKKNTKTAVTPEKKVEAAAVKTKNTVALREGKKEISATASRTSTSVPKPNPGDEKEWKLEYATSIDDLHMRMIGYPFPEDEAQNKEPERLITETNDKNKEPKKNEAVGSSSKSRSGYENGKMIELVIPEGTTEIKNYEFINRKDIVRVIIPEGVKIIGRYAFCGCSNLETVKLLRGVDCIMDSAFKNCKKLKRIGNVWNVNEIAETAFSGCDSINQDDSFDINRIIATARDIERGEKWPGKDYDLSYDPYGPRNWH